MLDAIKGFQKGGLKATETIITTRDGKRYREKKGEKEGETILEYEGQIATPAYLKQAASGFSSLQPQRYSQGKWRAATNTTATPSQITTLKFVTYNVWFAETAWR